VKTPSGRKQDPARKGLRDILLSLALISVFVGAFALNTGAMATGLLACAASILTFVAGCLVGTARTTR